MDYSAQRMEIKIETTKKHETFDITDKVNEYIKDVDKGICNVFVRHTTMAVIVNENKDSNIPIDILDNMERLFPVDAEYLHNKIDDNAEAHMKGTILGPSENIPIENGELKLGTYQRVILIEFDGPRKERKVNVEVVNVNNN